MFKPTLMLSITKMEATTKSLGLKEFLLCLVPRMKMV